MKKLGPKRWIHPRCAENRSRSGACEMCGDTLQPNSPKKKKTNTISRFMTPRKKRMRNQIQCQLCGVRGHFFISFFWNHTHLTRKLQHRYATACHVMTRSKTRWNVFRVMTIDGYTWNVRNDCWDVRYPHDRRIVSGPYVVFEYLHKQSLVQNSQSNTQVRSNRISGSLYPCSHTPGMVLVTMAVFLNEYEEEHDTEEQCVVVRWRIWLENSREHQHTRTQVLSGLTNRSLKGVCELHGTCVSRRLAPHGVCICFHFNHRIFQLQLFLNRYCGERHNEEAPWRDLYTFSGHWILVWIFKFRSYVVCRALYYSFISIYTLDRDENSNTGTSTDRNHVQNQVRSIRFREWEWEVEDTDLITNVSTCRDGETTQASCCTGDLAFAEMVRYDEILFAESSETHESLLEGCT